MDALQAMAQKISDMERQIKTLQAREHRTTFGRNVLGAVEYEHFRNDAAPADYFWSVTAPFAVPGVGTFSYNHKSDYLRLVGVSALGFLRKTVTTYLNTSFSARFVIANNGAMGIRADDNSDNNYTELNFYHAGGMNIEVRLRSRAGGGAVSTDFSGVISDSSLAVCAQLNFFNNTGSNHQDYARLLTETGSNINIGNTASVAWAISRVGLLARRDAGSGVSFCDWMYTDAT